ncbi:MAG TPA: substrate-binding domain-containing protein [Acidimicrobiales bacterium]|nr:substrate-binding domain-containing protein [Acidimicrobiales bacterium]
MSRFPTHDVDQRDSNEVAAYARSVRRVLAVVAAAAMIAGSLAIRSAIDRDRSDAAQVLRLTCATELDAACRRIAADDDRVELTVEPAGVTADRLATLDAAPDLDGWLVAAPWPEIVDGQRRARALAPLFSAERPTVARSPLVFVIWRDRFAALSPRCPAPASPGWRCLGEAAATPGGWAAVGGRPEWGPVKPGHASPDTDGVGLLVLGQAVVGFFGRTDLSSADLDDEAFTRWFAALERAVPPAAGSPLESMLVVGPAAFDAAGTTEAEAVPLISRSARGDALTLLYPSPMATADVVLATTGGGREPRSLRERLDSDEGRQALTDTGWRVGSGSRPDLPALAATSGLPSPGFLDALRGRWREVARR